MTGPLESGTLGASPSSARSSAAPLPAERVSGDGHNGHVATDDRPGGTEPAAAGSAALGGEADASPVTYTVIAPVWNEAETLPLFFERVSAVMDALGEPWELILVDDGSADGSREIMRRLHQQDPRVKAVLFSRNFGAQVAITAGLDHARGAAIIFIDADLQDPPEVIPRLIERWREGYQVVYATRETREGETWFKKFTASLFYRMIRRISNVDIPVDTGEFRLLDRRAADALRSIREQHRYVRGLAAWIGFRATGVPYQRAARHAGATKYPFKRMLRLAIDGITNFSYLPLQLATYAGFVVAGISLLSILATVALRLFWGHALTGQATTLVSVLFLGGIQLICLGVMGEYLGRIYDEVKRRPLYIVEEKVGL